MGVRLLCGDAPEMLATLEPESIDACVTDPPYGLKFMGKAWDHGVPGVPYWEAVSRVLQPGAWLLAFGGTRTHHRLMVAIEDAGFEIRDCLMWLHGQGFPKGKGCLKPAWEPIILARKPGPRPWLNVDGCRIAGIAEKPGSIRDKRHFDGHESGYALIEPPEPNAAGRWPANVVLSHEDGCRAVGTKRVKSNNCPPSDGFKQYDGYGGIGTTRSAGYGGPDGYETTSKWDCVSECAVRLLDKQVGPRTSGAYSGARQSPKFQNTYGAFAGTTAADDAHDGSAGPVSRFFYCSKASTAERGQGNDWPTVKPLALMSWLVKLVTPPGGTVLDPFVGSGSTLIAADRLGFDCIGIDSDPHAVEIATRRLEADAGIFADVVAS